MNERIRQLKRQAEKYAGDYGLKHGAYGQDLIDVLDQKFAELIVKECIRIPYDMWDKAELNADVAQKIDHKIKAHFGIEQ